MIHIIFAWALLVLGLIDIALAVRAWSGPDGYLPFGNFVAIAAGVVAVVAGVLLLWLGPQLAIGWLILAGGVLGALGATVAHALAGMDDAAAPTPPLWHALIGVAVAIVGILVLVL